MDQRLCQGFHLHWKTAMIMQSYTYLLAIKRKKFYLPGQKIVIFI